MEVLSLQIFVSLVLVLGSVLLFAYAAKGRDQDHAERLALLPLEADAEPTAGTTVNPTAPKEKS